ncbi:hypothetical protein [Hymenobacter cellulosivorans]|uniref:Lipocalin-like domain-containing protein n=1 Tax=Hymenobacter cellulosivorans TaxID=2932249 RepID=A0ABY4F8J9_9BACT|nr:hypothetical protein [Hymenobacter cellulosivorans]UOQ52988.1 hypothetical protein MUN80_25025 [Hymenobacter cellulosivorans]
MLRRLAFLLALPLLLGSCDKESDTAAPVVSQTTFEAQIQGRGWLESWEEEQPGSDIKVFRPETATFPASWPRNGFRFEADGVFIGRGPSPTDGVAVYPGRWLLVGNQTFRITPSGQSNSYGLQVVSLENDILKIRRVE